MKKIIFMLINFDWMPKFIPYGMNFLDFNTCNQRRPANLVIQKKILYKNLRGCKSPEKLMTIFSKYKMSKKIKNVSIFSVKTLGVSSRAVGSTKI